MLKSVCYFDRLRFIKNNLHFWLRLRIVTFYFILLIKLISMFTNVFGYVRNRKYLYNKNTDIY